jgi:hypothetical protein
MEKHNHDHQKHHHHEHGSETKKSHSSGHQTNNKSGESSFSGLSDLDIWRKFKDGDKGAFIYIYITLMLTIYSRLEFN